MNSDATGKDSSLSKETQLGSRLFENARMPGEAGAAASPAGTEGVGTAAEVLDHGNLGRTFSALGNALFYGAVGASAFFGYYHYNYDADQLEHMIQETEKAENRFPGSSVRMF